MIKRTLILFTFFAIAFCSLGQNNLKGFENYAINDDGDTIRGFIEEIGESRITVASLYKNEYRVKRLSTKTIHEYHLNDTVYRRVGINIKEPKSKDELVSTALTSKVFLKLLIDGPIALYERNVKRIKLMDPVMNSDAKGFLQKVPEKQIFVHYDHELPAAIISPSNFYEVSMMSMGKKSRIKQRLNSGYYTYENMEQMILDYNYLVEHNIE